MTDQRSTRRPAVSLPDLPAVAPESVPESGSLPNVKYTPDEFDIDQLEQELDVAIAAELGEDQDRPAQSTPKTPAEPEVHTEPTPTPNPEPADEYIPSRRPARQKRIDDSEQATSASPTHTLAARILAPCTRPVERLSPNARVLLNVVVISTALWVPLVWLMVTTDGMGFLHSTSIPGAPTQNAPAAIDANPTP